jgi:hypothetical protein
MNEDLFWSKVEKTDTCWIWHGTRDKLGYGRIDWIMDGTRVQLAHRAAFILVKKFHPSDLDHICVNPPCVNPEHLNPTTRGENFSLAWQRRGWGPGSRVVDGVLVCKNGHAITPENTVFKGRQRYCRACKKLNDHLVYVRRRDRSIITGQKLRP